MVPEGDGTSITSDFARRFMYRKPTSRKRHDSAELRSVWINQKQKGPQLRLQRNGSVNLLSNFRRRLWSIALLLQSGRSRTDAGLDIQSPSPLPVRRTIPSGQPTCRDPEQSAGCFRNKVK